SAKRQETRLDVTAVKDMTGDGTLFDITYGQDKPESVQFRNRVPGDTPAEREAVVRQRAKELTDWSVEQTFVTGGEEAQPAESGKSRYFTVRTTEREPELVQVMINRLLVDDNGQSLLQKTTIKDANVTAKGATLHFTKPASPGYLKLLVAQAFRAE